MKNLNSEETLWVLFPLIIVIGALIVSIIILPNIKTEDRTKASEITPSPTKIISPASPEVVCTSLYSPVCSPQGITYPNACEANKAGVTTYTKGECQGKAVLQKVTPQPLPASN